MENLLHAAQVIKVSRRCVVFSGAGMSADSGIATFRSGSGGVWNGFFGMIALAYGGTPLGWKLTPSLVWSQFISQFYEPIANAEPHVGYSELARLEREHYGPGRMSTVTMNVDGFHQKSGAITVFEVHGSVRRFRCVSCANPIDILDPIATKHSPPRCQCGGYPRPDCTLFTEALPDDDWAGACRAISQIQPGDVMLVIGTSSVVYPAAGLPRRAEERGAVLIEINPDEKTPLAELIDIHLRGSAAEILPRLVNEVILLQTATLEQATEDKAT